MFSSHQTWALAIAALGAVPAAAHRVFGSPDTGKARFFADQAYHFQTLRALNDIAAGGADTSEVLETIRHIRSGDAQGWFEAWSQTADRVATQAAATSDPIARGRALLRAHNYYRTGEFFLPPNDPKRPLSAAKNTKTFYAGLAALDRAGSEKLDRGISGFSA